MTTFKNLLIISLSIIIISCGSNTGQNKNDFNIQTNAIKGNITNNEILKITLDNKKGHVIDSISFTINKKKVDGTIDLTEFKLGKHIIEATVFYNNEKAVVSTPITILNSEAPKVYTYKIINEYAHDKTSYTQGLEFYNGELYESTGQRKASKLRKVDYKTGAVLKNIDLPDDYFGEGLTILNDKIYQLTWQSGIGFVYDVNSFEKLNNFSYGTSKEGWGICNDSKKLFKSDGTENIWILNPETLVEEDYIQVYTNKGKIVELNELEWIDGKIYANRWQKDGVAIINPKNGAIIGVIDFSPLKKLVSQHESLDVLNGIAYNPETKTVFVTGKYWDKLFEVEILEK
ncbi:glutaminyl-peptide cyclotransferase [Mariniflexile sp.]|uniref:glutaminyl-peptide cyclotransferase n=1 Tax=Mariniflexile sp. TaxID=1979402 RepID=UPI0035664B93